MKSQFTGFVVFGLLFAFALAKGQAQSPNTLHFQVPFAFVAGGVRLPAGGYTISETSTTGVFEITGKAIGIFVTMPFAPEGLSTKAMARFSLLNGERHLTALQFPGSPSRSVPLPMEHKLP
jgi:hypothetical protein